MEGIVQRLRKNYKSKLDFAHTYYTILMKMNNIELTKTQMNLLCHCAINGTISSPPVRDSFMKEYHIPKGTIYNITAYLQKIKLLVKVNSKVRLNPAIQLDFNRPFYKLEIVLLNNKES